MEHSSDLTVEAMMLDSQASDLDKEERPEVFFYFLWRFTFTLRLLYLCFVACYCFDCVCVFYFFGGDHGL